MENAYIVQGGAPLRGEVNLSGAKNVALKIIISALLFNHEVIFNNIPKIKDVEVLLNLINKLGSKAFFIKKNKVLINGTNLKQNQIDFLNASKIRVSFMLFAPLLHHFGFARIPNPGGCRLGGRPIDRSINLIRSFGVEIIYDNQGYYNATLKKRRLQGATFRFEKPSHTGTELAILLGVLAEGETVISNVSLEPEIDDLIRFLNFSGAKIKRKNRSIIIQGAKKLSFNDEYSIISDRNEAITYAIFGLTTRGSILIKGIEPTNISFFIDKVRESGGEVRVEKNKINFNYRKELKATTIVTAPHPGFMTDWQAPWAVLMTQANGVSIIHETVFENRFSYVVELKKLGAKIDFFYPRVKRPELVYQFNLKDGKKPKFPQAIKIYGKNRLHNGVLNVSDLRAGASLLIAAAMVNGESIIQGADIIDRGYEEIDKKLKLLGLKIKKI